MVALEREAAPEAAVSADAIPLRLRRRGGTARQVLAMSLIGSLVLALFAASDLPGWADRLGDAPFAETASQIARSWARATTAVGLDRPHEAIRDTIRRALDWQW
jgi:hypothetical protein